MVYFGVFFVLPNFLWFPDFYADIPDFYDDILFPSLYLCMPYLYVICGRRVRVVQSRRGVGCEVSQENK